MPSAHLRIDTSLGQMSGQPAERASARSAKESNRTPGSSSLHSARSSQRLRSASTSSTTSNPAYALDHASTSQPPLGSRFRFAVTEASNPPSASPTDSEGEPDTSEYVLAMHDFSFQQPNVTCLSFHAGQVIRVFNRDPSGWWDGELDGRRGWFPSNYVTSDVGLLSDEELPQLLVSTSSRPHHVRFDVAAQRRWANQRR